MRWHLLPVSMWACAMMACSYLDGKLAVTPEGSTLLRLEQESDGDLRYCDAQGNCINDLPNPGQCAALEVMVDAATGATCETCFNADGGVLTKHCGNTSVACVLVTNSDPDCVVCAYLDRSVLYLTCAEEGPTCEHFVASANGGWDTASPSVTSYDCKRCYDAGDRLIIDTCAHDCANEVCLAVDCAQGYEPVIYPGECCPRCAPLSQCAAVLCAAEATSIPGCFTGYRLVRDPNDCCGYSCLPEDCSLVACPATSTTCPSGYTWDTSGQYPDCCGKCVPSSSTRYCTDPAQCQNGDGCIDGTCRPTDHVCSSYSYPPYPCAGYWADGGRDEFGCPQSPVCLCYDGTASGDGTCPDHCGNTAAFAEGCSATSCAGGYHCDSGYPYCSGVCVADGECLYDGLNSATGTACSAVSCPTGYREDIDANTCCPTCVPDNTVYCVSAQECAAGELCSTSCGDCMTDPTCAPGDVCAGTCWGACVTTCQSGVP